MTEIRTRTSEAESMMKNKLYVENLPSAFTEHDLMDLFSSFGNIVDVKVQVNGTHGRPRNYGCVTMETPQGSRLAMQALNGKEIGAFTLIVSESRPMERRQSVVF
jgi:CUG-BP- and ETR3-like factor